MRRTAVWMVGLALVACHCESGPSPARVAGPNGAAKAPDGPALRDHMAAHFEAVTELQLAVAQGRLMDARDKAGWFVAHPMTVPAWQPRIDEMRSAARRIQSAKDLPAAAHEVGWLGRACAACHDAEGAHVAFAPLAVPPEVETPESRMARHQWAAARLWEGLVAPSDALWEQGAQILTTARIDVAKLAHAKPNALVAEHAEQLTVMARKAVITSNPDDRAMLYGEMLQTCAGCHAMVRPTPVPAR